MIQIHSGIYNIMEEDKRIKQRIIEFYEVMLADAIKKEDYENAIRYRNFIDNLKKSGTK